MKCVIQSCSIGLVLLAGIACAGSGPKPETAEEAKLRAAVKIGQDTPHSNCEELKVVTGSAGFGGWTKDEDEIVWAQDEMREKALALGGNFVVMDNMMSKENEGGTTMSGRAFRCGDPPAAPVAAAQEEQQESPPPQASPEERLSKLDELLEKDLITQEEYDERRKAILESL